MRRHAADGHRVPRYADADQPEFRQVNDDSRLVQPLLQHRDQRHAAGQRLRLGIGTQRLHRIGEARWLLICKIIHRAVPRSDYSTAIRGAPPWMIDQSFCGVAGMSICRTPYGFRASTTALMIAGGEPIAPTSPQPFTPSGLCVHSVVSVPTVMFGRSSARGMV